MAILSRVARIFLALSFVAPTLGQYNGNGNPFTYGGVNTAGNDNGDTNGSGFAAGSGRGPFGGMDPVTLIVAHAILATVAIGAIFPIGGIIIRLLSFRGVWLVHGLFQLIGYFMYIAAFGIGIWMAINLRQLDNIHAILGIVVFALLIFQPFTGYLHHRAWLRIKQRGGWSFLHVWLGRIAIIIGIVNGGLGLQLGMQLPFARPSQTWVIVYSVVAGVLGSLYILSIFIGEKRRSKQIALKKAKRQSTSRNSSSSSAKSRKSTTAGQAKKKKTGSASQTRRSREKQANYA